MMKKIIDIKICIIKNYRYQNMHNKTNDFDFYIDLEKFKNVLEEFEK